MRVSWHTLANAASVALLIPICGFGPGAAQSPSAKIGADYIVTAAPVYEPLAELRGRERFPEGAQLLLVHESHAEQLVPGFAASADANISFDGATVLFAGKKNANDRWQIWELTLSDRSVRKVIETGADAERPFYLPGGRMVWAQRTAHGFQLESAEIGGNSSQASPPTTAAILPLVYTQANSFPADVLKDGRILFESGFPLGSGSTPELYLVYSDGSGVESYRCDHGSPRWGGHQLSAGDVVFTHGSSLARFTSPLDHEEPIAAPSANYVGAITETPSGAWLVSARAYDGPHYQIKLWEPGAASKSGPASLRTVLARRGEDLVDPVLLASRTRPNRHPSALHPWDYANLLALDARISRDGVLKGTPVAVRLESQTASGDAVIMGTAPVEPDGSFFVKVPCDKPIRFALLDAKGAVLRRERGWFWSRGGEQRICVGCHTGPERASENRVPAVLLHTTTPVDLTRSIPSHGAPRTSSGGL